MQENPFSWSLFLQWTLATTVGWVVGAPLGNGLAVGLTMGLAQWLVLRPLVGNPQRWILLTAAGWMLAHVVAITIGVDGVFAGIILGAVTGFAQWLALREWYRMSGWWILASTAGWGLGLEGFMGPLLVGAVAGLVLAIVLDFLVRFFPLNR